MPAVPLIVRGSQTVPPRQVEQVLLGHPAVAEAVVVGVPERWMFTEELPRTPDGKVRRAAVTARFAVMPAPQLPLVDPIDLFRPRPATEDLRIPRQVRRSWALEDL